MTKPRPKPRPKHPPGVLVDIHWDETATAWYVTGHVPLAQAVEVVRAELEAEAEEGQRDHVPELGGGAHTYARWAAGHDEDGEPGLRWYCPVPAKPGAFLVTEVIDLDDLNATKRAREAERAHAADLEAWVRAKWPEATDVKGHGYPPGRGTVHFQLPELAGTVRHEADRPTTVQIREEDRDTWHRLYRGRVSPVPHPNDPPLLTFTVNFTPEDPAP